MALRYIDSMGDHYTAAQANLKWTVAFNAGRVAGLHGFALSGRFEKGLVFGSNTILQECYIKRAGPEHVFALFDTGVGTAGGVTQQCWCAVNTDGSITVSRFGSSAIVDVIAQTPPDLVRTGTWYHLGWKVLVHPTAGAIEVRLNGGTVINVTGVRTTTSLNPVSDFWSGQVGSFRVGDNAGAVAYDDLVVMDDVADGLNDPRLPGGGGFNKFIGPVTIIVKRPNGAGTLAEWTPAPAVPNWQNVDDPESDDDTTYNGADGTAVGKSDLFAMEDLAALEDVVAVQSLVLARKTADGVAAVARLVNDGGTTTVGTTVYQPNTYAYLHRAEPALPDGTLWTRARWNGIQYGYRRMV